VHAHLLHGDPDRQEEGKELAKSSSVTQHILNNAVNRVDVPHFPSLSLDKILAQFKRPHPIYDFLPDEVNEFVVNRQFVLDVSLAASQSG